MSWKGEKYRHGLSARGVKSRRQKYNSGRAKNLKMNDDVYKLRREVMKYIYEAKDLCDLPRINVRITDTMEIREDEDYSIILGLADMSKTVAIWIPKDAIEKGYDLRTITYHEILHTVFGAPHVNDDNDIMNVYHVKLTKTKADREFKKWAKKLGGNCK